jgi:hypothetical protein
MKFLKYFGIGLTQEEELARAEKKYSGITLVNKILEIEGVKGEAAYYRLIDLCAKYKVDFAIPCNGGC